jgi:hypothetical protein
MSDQPVTEKGKIHRVQFDFSQEAFDELEKLSKRLHDKNGIVLTRAETARQAFGFLRAYVNAVSAGESVGRKKAGGEFVEWGLPGEVTIVQDDEPTE